MGKFYWAVKYGDTWRMSKASSGIEAALLAFGIVPGTHVVKLGTRKKDAYKILRELEQGA